MATIFDIYSHGSSNIQISKLKFFENYYNQNQMTSSKVIVYPLIEASKEARIDHVMQLLQNENVTINVQSDVRPLRIMLYVLPIIFSIKKFYRMVVLLLLLQ